MRNLVLALICSCRAHGFVFPGQFAPRLHAIPRRSVASSSGPSLRLERILSNRGAGSRREVAAYIKSGRVRVDGKVVKSPSEKVLEASCIILDKAEVKPVPLLVAFHKPLDVLSAMGDPSGRPSLKDFVPPEWERMGLHPVGRLGSSVAVFARCSFFHPTYFTQPPPPPHPLSRPQDADTTGLLVFSSDGQLTQRLLHPSGGIEREYLATVEGDALRADLGATLAAGVATADGTFPAALLEQGPHTVRLAVTEGKYRMVRRILNNAGLPVTALHRLRYGAVVLADLDLPAGQWCHVPPDAAAWAKGLLRR
jgi:23S rRNA pseudouridine2605 synthase